MHTDSITRHTTGIGRLRGRTPRLACAAALLMALTACAPRAMPPPPVPAAPAHPEFVFPAVPAALRGTPEAERLEFGWRYLQANDLRSASREFATVLGTRPAFYPAQAAEGYVALARGDHAEAVARFDTALRASATYVPALVGRGHALAELRRDGEALASFEEALAVDASLADVQLRVQALRLRQLGTLIDAARRAAADDRLADARADYQRALEASPDSAFLHRELGSLERRAGDADAALEHFTRASALDPFDDESLVRIGEILEERQDLAGAEAAYRRAATIAPDAALDARIAAVAEKSRDAGLPPELGAIEGSEQITRGELAALIGTRLEPVLRRAPQQPVVLTDAQDHWAAPWIVTLARTGVLPPFQNHLFEPDARVRRMDLADAVRGLVTLLAGDDPALRARLAERPAIADVSAAHLSYPAVAAAVASGVMDLYEGRRFEVARPVSGAEALDAVTRVRGLAGLR